MRNFNLQHMCASMCVDFHYSGLCMGCLTRSQFGNFFTALRPTSQSPISQKMESSGFWAHREKTIASFNLLIVAATAVAALGAWLWWCRWTHRDTVGPKAWPLIGALPELRDNWGNLHEYLTAYFSSTQTTVRLPLGLSAVALFTVDPDSVEYILKTNFSNYPKGPINAAINQEMFGHGIFNVDGDEWKQQRRVSASEFAAAKLRDFSTNIFKDSALKLAAILLDRSHSSQPFNLQDLFMRMTLDTTCQVGFGVDLGCLAPSLPDLPFSKSFENTNAASFLRFVDPLWRVKRFFQIGQEKVLKQSVEVLDTFTYDVIRTRRSEIPSEVMGKAETGRQDLLSRFMKLSMEGDHQFNDRALRDIILNFIVAGRDTTAVSLSWFFSMLCCHPEVAEKIREELAVMVQKHSTSGEETNQTEEGKLEAFAELLTYENLGGLNYLHAALTETLRLYPPVPIDGKYAMADDALPDGTQVKRGNIVAFYAYAMGRMEHLWGANALEFKPERWLRDGVFQQESPFKFTAFQAGPRLCLGRDSAYLQMKLTAALLISFFDVHLVPEHPVHYRTMILLTMLHGLEVTVNFRPS